MKKPTIKQLLVAKKGRETEVSKLWESMKKHPIYKKIKQNRKEIRAIQKLIEGRL